MSVLRMSQDLHLIPGLHQFRMPPKDEESVAGSVIQATRTVEFEDGLWIGNHLKAQNGLQRVCTIPGVQPRKMQTPRFLRGQTEFQSAWVHMATWCWARCRIWFPAAAMLGLTWPMEAGKFVLLLDVRQNPLLDTSFLQEGVHSNKIKQKGG